jgi:hypothetical protein
MDTYLAYSRLMDLNGMDDSDVSFCIMIHTYRFMWDLYGLIADLS